jgi:hypothetical protein
VDVVATRDSDTVCDAWIHGIHSAEFKTLVDAKQRAIVPMMVIYIVGYLGLSILAGFGRGLLGIKVFGSVNLGFVLIGGNYLNVMAARGGLRAHIGAPPRSFGKARR